jgi:hypothetical protein
MSEEPTVDPQPEPSAAVTQPITPAAEPPVAAPAPTAVQPAAGPPTESESTPAVVQPPGVPPWGPGGWTPPAPPNPPGTPAPRVPRGPLWQYVTVGLIGLVLGGLLWGGISALVDHQSNGRFGDHRGQFQRFNRGPGGLGPRGFGGGNRGGGLPGGPPPPPATAPAPGATT